MLGTNLRQVATVLLESAIRIAPPDTREWGQAVRGELSYVEGPWAAVMWALGGASVMVKHALISLFIPGRQGHSIAPDGGLFAKNVSLRKVALVTAGGCIVGALTFFAAPPFRQGLRVAISPWTGVFLDSGDDLPRLVALARRAEQQRDPEGLAFCAVRVRDDATSARLAKEAVGLEPNLVWVYAVVALRHPRLPEIGQWVSQLERWNPQNALFPLITAESIDSDHFTKAANLPSTERQRELEGDPAWQRAMAAAFASPKFDDYWDRLKDLDRKVVPRYGFNDPLAIFLRDGVVLPSHASQEFAKSLLQSGQNLEARGDRKGAGREYWAVARFGQMIDSQGHTGLEHWTGTALQAMAYQQLEVLSRKEGNHDEAALFSYLAASFDPVKGMRTSLTGDSVFGPDTSRRNAAVLQISSVMMLIFSGFMVVAASIWIAGNRRDRRPTAQPTRTVATLVALTCGVGLLLSSATIYLTFRPYWYIFQRAILKGNLSQTRDLGDFLGATGLLVGRVSLNLPVYFWAGVILLGTIGVAFILLRHILAYWRSNRIPHIPHG